MSEQLGRKGVLFIFLIVASFLVYLSFFGFTTNTSKLSVSVSPLLQDEAMLYLVSKGSQARCLDGSQPAYYIHRGIGTGKYKWLVFFEGGGWCYDLKQCYLRSKTVLGSSKNYRSRMTAEELRFYFSGSKAANPAMHNWNIVYVRYCDGGSYAGDAVREYNVSVCYLCITFRTICLLEVPVFNIRATLCISKASTTETKLFAVCFTSATTTPAKLLLTKMALRWR